MWASESHVWRAFAVLSVVAASLCVGRFAIGRTPGAYVEAGRRRPLEALRQSAPLLGDGDVG